MYRRVYLYADWRVALVVTVFSSWEAGAISRITQIAKDNGVSLRWPLGFLTRRVEGKNRDILHFHQCLRVADGSEARIEAQECGYSLIQPFDQKDHSMTIAAIDDVTAVVPDCGARRAWQAHTLASSSGYQEIRMSLSVSVIRPIAECSVKPSSAW